MNDLAEKEGLGVLRKTKTRRGIISFVEIIPEQLGFHTFGSASAIANRAHDALLFNELQYSEKMLLKRENFNPKPFRSHRFFLVEGENAVYALENGVMKNTDLVRSNYFHPSDWFLFVKKIR